jgi:hypothetical protein
MLAVSSGESETPTRTDIRRPARRCAAPPNRVGPAAPKPGERQGFDQCGSDSAAEVTSLDTHHEGRERSDGEPEYRAGRTLGVPDRDYASRSVGRGPLDTGTTTATVGGLDPVERFDRHKVPLRT